MGITYDLLQWATESCKRHIQLLFTTLAVFPFVVIVALFLLVLGIVPSPLLNTLEKISKDHVVFQENGRVLADSMIQINRVAEEYYELYKTHAEDSKRRQALFEFLVLEGCRRDNKEDLGRCERLESKLNTLER